MVAFLHEWKDREAEIVELFASTFAFSEGKDEGELIGKLVRDIFKSTKDGEIYGFLALENHQLVGAILFTRMNYREDSRSVFLLSPVAVRQDSQGKGVGQKLILHGLNALQKDGVEVALTYGDINFYSKVGFSQISERDVQPPYPLQYPHGWLGQSLTAMPLKALKGTPECVEAFRDPQYW